jgi:chromosomal replication initiator protein
MDHSKQDPALNFHLPGHEEAWQMVLGNLQAEMSRALYETWVQPLKPIGYQNQVFTVGAFNAYGRSWVEERLGSHITHLLEGLYGEPSRLK